MRPYKSFLASVCMVAVISFGNAQKQSEVLRVDPPHGDPAKLPNLCADCHFGYGSPNPSPTINDKCLSCHNGITAPAAETHRGVSCTVCHNPHHQEQERENGSTYSKLVRTTVNSRPVRLMRSSGPNSFADGDAVYDGICEVCHTTTRYHRNNGTGQPHNNASNCVTCHPHGAGFSAPAGGPACLQCHQSQMGSRRPVAADFSSPQPHHPLTYNASGNLNSPDDNNCIICHNDYPGQHANGVVNLRAVPDAAGTGNDSSGTNLSPWCLRCHDGNNPDPLYRLGGQLATDKSGYFSPQNAHTNGPGLDEGCIACHDRTNYHTAPVKFFSNFYLDDKEENTCFGCHGGAANVNNSGRYMENIRVAYTTGNINTKSKHVNGGSVNTSDGLVFCRNCHDPHLLNHTTNLLIDPQNRTQPWTGTMREYCFRCHDGSAIPNHLAHMELINVGACTSCHSTSGPDPLCTDCHQSHGSTLQSLVAINITGKTMSLTPPSATITVGGLQYFNSIVNPPFTQFSQNLVNKLATWSFVTSSGGSSGTEYMRTHYIPLDRTIGYDPNANGGYGLITVTSSITIPANTVIEDLNVYFNASHHYRGDIDLTLTHVATGRSVHVQAYDWWDWGTNLDFWYDSESPNDPHGNLSPRSTAQSLTAFDGESASGEWVLTILDTWPNDNPTNPSDPNFCKVNSWGISINGGIVVSLSSTPGLAIGLYAGTGTLYSRLHNGKLVPAQNGLDVSVSENPPPLQATASLTVNSPTRSIVGAPPVPLLLARQIPEVPLQRLVRQSSVAATSRSTHRSLAGSSCSSCHQTMRN